MKRRIEQGGFTLIELVVVITILGILAAFAVPRFAQLEGQARLAATQALAGSIRSGASLSHALWVAQSDPASTSVTMEGTAIAMVNGYPTNTFIDDTLVEFTGFAFTTPGDIGGVHQTVADGNPDRQLLRDVHAGPRRWGAERRSDDGWLLAVERVWNDLRRGRLRAPSSSSVGWKCVIRPSNARQASRSWSSSSSS